MILVLGENGQLARALRNLDPKVRCLGRKDCDLAYPDQLEASLLPLLESGKVKCLINAAAYTQVDQAETDQEKCLAINGASPKIIAKLCEKTEVPFIHYSSDYTYGNNGTEVMDETTECKPLNFYAKTKLVGDEGILSTRARALILRTSWVYDHQGKNFFTTMIKLFESKPHLTIVSDQVGSPTYAPDIAAITIDLIKDAEKQSCPEIIHLTNRGLMSWHDFAQLILEGTKKHALKTITTEIKPIKTTDWPTPAKRQLNSRLSLSKLTKKFGISPRTVEQALEDCFKRYLGTV